jgi:hypothetical protein
MDNKKVKVSKNEFAEVLYYWLSERLTKKSIEESAKELHFEIRSSEDFDKIFRELLILNMWLITRICERVFEDENKRNECLDIFHHLAHERHIEGTEEDFSKWMKLTGTKYIEYNTAMDTNHPSTPLWVLAKLINKNLFGEVKEDIWVQMEISAYAGIPTKHLEELMEKYDIE